MGHCIQVIVAPFATADLIAYRWPELARLDRKNRYSIFPVEADLIDAKITPNKTPTVTDDAFMLLTDGFRNLLRVLSRDGILAYVETEYFGGVGGQGAIVCCNGKEVMPPIWRKSGTINDALKHIGMKRGLLYDRFAAAGFMQVRDNDDILDLIASQAHNKNA